MPGHITSFEKGASAKPSDAVKFLRAFLRRQDEARQLEGPSHGSQGLADFTGSATERRIHGALFVQAMLEYGTRMAGDVPLKALLDPEIASTHAHVSPIIFEAWQRRTEESEDLTIPMPLDPSVIERAAN